MSVPAYIDYSKTGTVVCCTSIQTCSVTNHLTYPILFFLAMHAALDDSVANVTKALIRAGMINNTVIVFTSDNGGIKDTAPNWPLR